MQDDDAVFTALYREHYEKVLAYALRRTSPESARDAVADTFLVAWRRRTEKHRDELPWLLAVARRVIGQQSRTMARQAALDIEMRRLSELAAGSTGDTAAEVVERMTVFTALAALSEMDREAIVLTAWEGLTPSQGAIVIGCSAATFRVRLHRARRRVIALLRSADAGSSPHASWSAPDISAPVDVTEIEEGA